jgi:type I restriction enzyme, R subunit
MESTGLARAAGQSRLPSTLDPDQRPNGWLGGRRPVDLLDVEPDAVSTGEETNFQSRRDPILPPRDVFSFHRPETLAAWAQVPETMRLRLRTMPPVHPGGLRDVQFEALQTLEASLADDRPKALVDLLQQRRVRLDLARQPERRDRPLRLAALGGPQVGRR